MGRFSLVFSEAGYKAAALDIDKNALSRLRDASRKMSFDIELIIGDLDHSFPIRHSSLRVAVLSHVLHWLSSPQATLAEVAQCLEAPGLLFVLFYDHADLAAMRFYSLLDSRLLEIQQELTPRSDVVERFIRDAGLESLEKRRFSQETEYSSVELRSILESRGTRALQIYEDRFGEKAYVDMSETAIGQLNAQSRDAIVNLETETILVARKVHK
jgi:SAM-dependent methyltransferase